MPNFDGVLRLEETEILPPETHAYQIDDGTIFYHKHTIPQRLYAKWRGKTIPAKLPDLHIDDLVTCEDALYFQSNGKIFKAHFAAPKVEYEHVRAKFADEQIFRGGVCSRVLPNGTTYAFRIQDHFLDGVVVEDEEDYLRGFVLVAVHRGKAYYAKHACGGVPTVTKLSETVFMIELPHNVRPTLIVRESWSLIYIENDKTLFALNTHTMEFMKPLKLDGAEISCSLIGIHEGVLSTMCRSGSTWSIMTARLPSGYAFEQSLVMTEFLRASELETFHASDEVYQVDSGTVFYYDRPTESSAQKLYVKFEGKEVCAKLPENEINCIGAYGVALYFTVHDKIHKAVFSPPDFISIFYVRELLQKEEFYKAHGFFGRGMYSYRIQDDPEADKKLVNADIVLDDRAWLVGIHRGSSIYVEEHGIEPSLDINVEDALVLLLPTALHHPLSWSRDSSPFVYVTEGVSLYTINTETMQIMPALNVVEDSFIEDSEIPSKVTRVSVMNVRDEVITLKAEQGRMQWSMMTAQLPDGYFSRTAVDASAVATEMERLGFEA